jgi:hypothetical protein
MHAEAERLTSPVRRDRSRAAISEAILDGSVSPTPMTSFHSASVTSATNPVQQPPAGARVVDVRRRGGRRFVGAPVVVGADPHRTTGRSKWFPNQKETIFLRRWRNRRRVTDPIR